MRAPYLLLVLAWLAFLLAWMAAWSWSKPTERPRSRRDSLIHSVPTAIGMWLIMASFSRGLGGTALFRPLWARSPATAWLSAVLAVLGVIVAIWARWSLGRNWSAHVELKQDHELVTRGAYRWTRHPIYTGLLLMIGGSALAAGSPAALIGLPVAMFGLVIKLRQEEALMREQFPAVYPDYCRRTKRLVPFLW